MSKQDRTHDLPDETPITPISVLVAAGDKDTTQGPGKCWSVFVSVAVRWTETHDAMAMVNDMLPKERNTLLYVGSYPKS